MEPVAAVVATEALRAEKLTLLVAENKTGYFGVHLVHPGQPKPYQAKVTRGGKQVYLGMFATAEEAALCVARGRRRGGRRRRGRRRRRARTASLPCRPAPASRRRARSRPCRPAPS